MAVATDVMAVLGEDGLLSRHLDGYEQRPQQVEMSATIAEAMAEAKHAIVEAPTGVGKSFAYLVPAAQHALATNRKIVISTGTIALQEQLMLKDIPLLQKLFPELKATLVKGRQNYLSKRRLMKAYDGQEAWLETREQVHDLKEIDRWSRETGTGDKADIEDAPAPGVWRLVQSDSANCLGRRCPTYDTCFFYAARKEMEGAHILVVNHHLYFSDLSLRDEHASILPPHDVVIFDEAHALEDIATEHMGVGITEAQVRYHLDGLLSGRGRGLLAEQPQSQAATAVLQARHKAELFFADVAAAAPRNGDETLRLNTPDRFTNVLSPALDDLAKALAAVASECSEDASVHQEFKAQMERTLGFAGSLRQIVEQQLAGYVYYATVPHNKRQTISLHANPLAVGPLLKAALFDETETVVMTSATLAADDSERFLFLRRRLGLEESEKLVTKRLDSPFDYKKQAKLFVNEADLDPNGERYERGLSQWLGDYLEDARGGTFILFTSYRQLQNVYDLLGPRLERQGRFVLRQGGRIGRRQMIDLFKSTGDAVLFGTTSFWEGVDIRGDALKNVVITKLPFEMPAHPLTEARHNEITRRGGNPFMERTVPEAILRLKQGVGRLIRTSTDSGSIIIGDHRVLTKQYGRYFIRALPEMDMQRFRV